ASSPLAASPTTSMSGSPSRNAKSPLRTTAWSSTTRTRIVSPCLSAIGVNRKLDAHDGTATRRARDLELGTDLFGAAAHRLQAEVPGLDRVRVEPAPVVLNLDDHARRAGRDPDPRFARVCVPDHVGERLAPDAVQLSLGRPRERHAFLGPVDCDVQRSVVREARDVP